MDKVKWDEQKRELSGEALRAPNRHGAVFIYVPRQFRLAASSEAELVEPRVVRLPVHFASAREKWSVRFA